MSDDLVKRLRDWVSAEGPPEGRTAPDAVADMREAADRIETQANTIEELRAANERWAIAFKLAEAYANGRIEALREALDRIKAATGNEMRAGDKGYVSRYGIHGIASKALQETGQ